MGLDMYLFGIKADKKDFDEPSSGKYEELCYWRKANQIHKWFNVKFIKNQDPWGFYRVEEEDLQGLFLLCKMLKNLKESSKPDWVPTEYVSFVNDWDLETDYVDLIANSLLPPDNIGCFFGSGIIDEYYWEQIDDTINKLEKALSGNYSRFYYHASW